MTTGGGVSQNLEDHFCPDHGVENTGYYDGHWFCSWYCPTADDPVGMRCKWEYSEKS